MEESRSSTDLGQVRKRHHARTQSGDGGKKSLNTKETPVVGPSGIVEATAEELLAGVSPRWKNWWVRSTFGLLMLVGFSLIIYAGALPLLVLVQVLQILCYYEIICVGHRQYKKFNLPWFRTLSWYFMFALNYFFYGELMAEYVHTLSNIQVTRILLQHHRLISFFMYTTGIIMFVLSLRKNFYKTQFALFMWYQTALFFTLYPAHMVMQTIFQGLIWFVLSTTLIIVNDIGAYMCGFFFGRTQLIKLSPKKTWEGFIGGAIITVIYGILMGRMLIGYKHFVCPVQYDSGTASFSMDCEPNHLFQLASYQMPQFLQSLLRLVSVHTDHVMLYPMDWHVLVLGLFSSIIAPFAGFFASGFKRAFNIKDFGDTIPGHGGIMDRFDCQYLMGTFVGVYIWTFASVAPSRIMQQILMMSSDDQLQILRELSKSLSAKGLLGTAA